MTKLTVLGIDPSLSNFGYAKGQLDLDTGILSDVAISLVESPPMDKKQSKQVRKNSQDLIRSQIHFKALKAITDGVDLIFVEIPVGSQTARAMTSYGICIGLLASLNDNAMIQVTPSEVKVAATGKKTASKKEMIDWAYNNYPDAGWKHKKEKGEYSLVNSNEHPADALAAIHAGVRTDQFKQIRLAYLAK